MIGWKRWHQDSLDTRRQRAALHTAQTWDTIAAYRRLGYGWREVAKLLNCSDLVAPRGGLWHPNTVRRVHAQGLRQQERAADVPDGPAPGLLRAESASLARALDDLEATENERASDARAVESIRAALSKGLELLPEGRWSGDPR